MPAADDVITAEADDPPELLSSVERLRGVPAFDGVISSCDCRLSTGAAVVAARVPGPRFPAGAGLARDRFETPSPR